MKRMQKSNQISSISFLMTIVVSLTVCINSIPIANKSFAQIPSSNEYYKSILQLGSNGTVDGRFYFPFGISIDSKDNVYVADSGNNRVQKFDSNGNFISKFGTYGTGDGQFINPVDIAVDSSDNVYVDDSLNSKVQIYSLDIQNQSNISNITNGIMA